MVGLRKVGVRRVEMMQVPEMAEVPPHRNSHRQQTVLFRFPHLRPHFRRHLFPCPLRSKRRPPPPLHLRISHSQRRLLLLRLNLIPQRLKP